MKNLSIKLQLSLSAIAVGFVLLLAQLVLQFSVLRGDIVQRIEKNEFRSLTAVAQNLDEKLQNSMDMLTSVGANVPLSALGNIAAMEKLLQREHALFNVYDDLYIFDAKGVLLVDWPVKAGRRTLDMSSRDYIQGVIATEKQSFPNLFWARPPNNLLLSWLRPSRMPAASWSASLAVFSTFTNLIYWVQLRLKKMAKVGITTWSPKTVSVSHIQMPA